MQLRPSGSNMTRAMKHAEHRSVLELARQKGLFRLSEAIAAGMVFLASTAGRYMTGQIISIDGGRQGRGADPSA